MEDRDRIAELETAAGRCVRALRGKDHLTRAALCRAAARYYDEAAAQARHGAAASPKPTTRRLRVVR